MPRKRGRRGTNKRPSQPPVLEGGQLPAPAETPPQQPQQQAGPIPPPPSYQAPRPVGPIYLGHINPNHPTVHVIHHPADKMLLRPGVPPPSSSLHNVTVGGPRGVPYAANHHHTHHHSGGSSYYYGWQQHQAFGEWFGGIGSDGGPWYAVRHPPQPQSQPSPHHQHHHHHHPSRPPFFPSDGGPSVGVPPHLTMAQQQQQQRPAPNPHFFPPPPPPRFQPNFYPPNYYSGYGQALAPPETPFHMLLLKRSDWRLVESGAAMNPFSVGVRPSTHTLCDRIEIAELKATARPASFKPPVVSIPGLEAAPKTAIDDSAASPSAQCAPTSEKQPSSSEEAAEMVVGAEHQAADHHHLGQEEEEVDGNGEEADEEEEGECSSSSSDDGNNDDDQPPIATPPTDGELQQQPPPPPDAASSSPPRRSLVFYRVFFDHVTMHHFFLPGAHNTSHRNRTPNAKIGGVNCGMPDLPRLLVNFIHFTSGVPISHVDVFNPKQGLCTVWFDESQIGCEQQGSAAPLFATEEKMFNALIDAVHMKVWMPPPTDGCFLLGSSTEGRNHLQQLLSDLKHDSHGSSAPFPRHLMTVQRWESRPPEKPRPKSRQHGDDD